MRYLVFLFGNGRVEWDYEDSVILYYELGFAPGCWDIGMLSYGTREPPTSGRLSANPCLCSISVSASFLHKFWCRRL